MNLAKLRNAVVGVAALVALAGCGAQVQPGLAASLDGADITVAEVDHASEVFCTSITTQLATNALPMKILRSYVLNLLAVREIAAQVAEETGVSVPESYVAELTALETSLSEEYGEDAEVLAELTSTGSYLTAVAIEVGRKELALEGVVGADDASAEARGFDEFGQWSAAHDAWFDPRFEVSLGSDGLPQFEATGELSVSLESRVTNSMVSEAIAALSGQSATMTGPEGAALLREIKALPDSQRCGPAES